MIELCCEYLSVRCICLYVIIISRTCFRVNPQSRVAWMSGNSLLKTDTKSEVIVKVAATGLELTSTLIRERTLKHLAKLTKWLSFVVSCGFESSRNHLKIRFRACFWQGVPWNSGNCRVWIHSETRTWHDNNIQTNALYR